MKPGRVSSTRAGLADTYEDAAGNQPFTSTTTSNGCDVNTHTSPGAPSLAITAFGTVAPTVTFKFDAVGCGAPHGNTVTYPSPPASTAVTFSDTADASATTPPRPAT